MAIIKEPLDLDFVVDPRPLSNENKQLISAFIKADKAKRAKSPINPRTSRRKQKVSR